MKITRVGVDLYFKKLPGRWLRALTLFPEFKP